MVSQNVGMDGTWEIENNIKAELFGFEIGLRGIKPFSPSSGELGVSFILDVSLPAKLSASGGFEIIGKLGEDAKGRQKWEYDDFRMNSFGIDVTFAAGHIKGSLQTFNGNSTYGKGFQGRVSMDFKAVGKIDCMALFGRTDNNVKYFFVDASVDLATGIPAPPLKIDGFVGGVAYHMNVAPASSYNGLNQQGLPPIIGTSLSGAVYTPDSNFGLYLKAGVKLSLAANKSTFNGVVALEMLFNSDESDKGGGLASIRFDGKGQFMAFNSIGGALIESQDAKPDVPGSLVAHIRIEYDFKQNILSGKILAFLEVGTILYGAGTNKKMVDADIYISKDKWYIYIGTPTHRCGIKANIKIASVELKAYLDIGSTIPDLPDLPANVRAIASQVKKLSPSGLKGGGFLFGASLDLSATINLVVASGELKAGCGFDVIIKNYGENAKCAGREGTLGINGWYAMGQMYAYMDGKVKVMGINVLSAGMAAVLQAQLPNPFFAQATVGVRVKTWLGSFNKSFKVELGDFCAIQTDPNLSPTEQALGMRVFSEITPNKDSEGIDSEVKPEIFCNVPFDMDIETGNVKYSVKMKEVKIQSLKNNYIYLHSNEWNVSKDELALIPQQIFASYDSVRVIAIAEVFKNSAKIATDTIISIFTIGESLGNIPESNIEYSYPMNGMHNYHKEEYNRYQGFIQLKSGMPELFYNIPENMDQVIKLTQAKEMPIYFDYKYDGLSGKIVFPMDPAMFLDEEIYRLEIVRVPKGSYTKTIPSKGIDINTQANNITMGGNMGYPSNYSSQQNAVVKGKLVGYPIYSMYFRTSKYKSIRQKLIPSTYNNYNFYTEENFDHTDNNNMIEVVHPNEILLNNYMDMFLAIKKTHSVTKTSDGRTCAINTELNDEQLERILLKYGIADEIDKEININHYTINSFDYGYYPLDGKITVAFINDLRNTYNLFRSQIEYCVRSLNNFSGTSISGLTFSPHLEKIFLNQFTNPAEELKITYNIPNIGTTSTIIIKK